MKKFESAANEEIISEFTAKLMSDEENGEEFTREYLRAKFLSSVGRSLYYARRQAGLTQTQLAEQLHTTQSAIARFEADKNGTMSFRRYADFAIACGMMPRSLMIDPILEPIESLRDEMIARARMHNAPEAPSTVTHLGIEPIGVFPHHNLQEFTCHTFPSTEAIRAWFRDSAIEERSTTVLPLPTIEQLKQESMPTANSAERWLRKSPLMPGNTNAALKSQAQSTV